jgi:ankyrin repeat protein
MISCQEAVGLTNKIGTCWNVAIQTNMFYGHNSEIIQKKLNEQSVDDLLNPTVIENLERFLPPFLVDDNGKLLPRTLQLLQKIVINLKKRFDIKNKQKVTKMANAEEDVCERDFVYYVKELIHPGQKNKEDIDEWGGPLRDSLFLTNILDIILLNKLTHIVNYEYNYLSEGNRISLNIDVIKSIQVYLHQDYKGIDITDLTVKILNHACQFFECEGTSKYSNNNTIIEHDWRMFFKTLNMLSVTDYDRQKNDSNFTKFAEYDTPATPLPKYIIWENLEIGPYIVTYDSKLQPSFMYSFSPFFKKEKITNPSLILGMGQVTEFLFSYNIGCTPENITKLIKLNIDHYLSLDMMIDTMENNMRIVNFVLDHTDVNMIDTENETIIIKGIKSRNTLFVIEALKRINESTLNHQDNYGTTALYIALNNNNIPVVKEIMKYNPDLTLKVKQNGMDAASFIKLFKVDLNDLITPEFKSLKTAIQDDDLTEVESLLDELKYINETDYNEYTILMYAVTTSNNLEIVKVILEKDPVLSIKNVDGQTALDLAKLSKNIDMIELLDGSKPVSTKPRYLKQISSFDTQIKPVNVRPVNVKPINVKPVNVKPVNVKPKGRNDKCDIVDKLLVNELNEVFKEINKPIPAAKIRKPERLQILKDLLGC